MFKDSLQDTISAISTAQGEGGIGIVRLSGKAALAVADKIFISNGKQKPGDFKSHTMHYGQISDGGKIIDEVILTLMRRPKSYTREDVVEINCHGGLVALRKVLELTLKHGCRLALPGEFTKRAFLNGRIDLAQAEAVIDTIRAKTDSALKISVDQLSGGLSKEINKIRLKLLNVLVVLEASIDFPEEGLKPLDTTAIIQNLKILDLQLNKLLDSASSGRILREGICVVICGKPNVGKSSLLNVLLKKERSIVTSVAGTTRDTIEELIDIAGIPVRMVDTAGILKPRNIIEKKAVERSKKYIKLADLVLAIFDASAKLNPEDQGIIKAVKNKNVIGIFNKIDLKNRIQKEEITKIFKKTVEISAKSAKNINLLEEALSNFVFKGKLLDPESIVVSNLRHVRALKDAEKLINQAQVALQDKLSLEFITQNLKDAGVYLDRILGRSLSEDLLEKIFADFCIGK